MRYVMYAYLLIFFISVVVNCYFWLKVKANKALLLYEISAAFYLIAVSVVYFTPALVEKVNIWFCIPVIPVVMVDIYMTVWGKDETICPSGFEYDKNELEIARIMAVVFVAPAYISGIMLLIDKILDCSKD